MKHSQLLIPILLGAVLMPPIAHAKPAVPVAKTKPAVPVAKTKPALTASTLPSEVRAMMIPGATTVTVALLPVGDKGAPILLHAWTIERRSSTTLSGSRAPALYCVDLFYRDSYNQKKWELASSTSYLSEGAAYPGGITYEARWLQPATKKGMVIIENTTQVTGGIIRLITLPAGVENQPISQRSRPFVQEFFTSHSGGTLSVSISFGLDKKRGVTLEEEILPHSVAPQIRNTYAWTGASWTKVASRQTKQN